MKIGPKYKIARRLGPSVFEKTQTQKFALSQEKKSMARGKGRGRGPTEYGKQLLEKQKVRFTYGISERQFSRYVKEATSSHDKSTTPAELLHRALETRLDNVVYRLGLASTRRAARQMVSHGHVTVNGRKTTIPSRLVHEKDVIGVRQGSRSSVLFENLTERTAEHSLASWLSWNAKTMEGGLANLPTMASADAAGDLGAVLSFYSR